MADDFALVRIVGVNGVHTSNPSITVRQLRVDPAYGNASIGDVQVLDESTGTDVKIALAKKLTDTSGRKFAFKDVPICIAPDTGASIVPCNPGEMPPGFQYSLNDTKDAISVSVPQLAGSKVVYKYSLFMTMTRQNGTTKDIIIDPRITNGGQPFIGAERSSYEFVLNAATLLLLAILLVSLGTAFGWVLAGGRRP